MHAMHIDNLLDELADLIAARVAERLPKPQPAQQAAQPAEYLTTKQAAKLLACGTSTLELWRSKGKGPAYVKVGSAIRYSRAELETWIAAHARKPR
jgi:excisionase family DNA binding protein